MPAALIAIDWGTTSARAYRVDASGAIEDEREAPLGIAQIADRAFASALATLLGAWASEPLPRLACGMIGSRQGWIEAPYVDCPADHDALARALTRTPGGEIAIVAGVTCRDDAGIPDVMRGEETQIVGAIASRGDALAVLPGTHSKWVRVAGGRIDSFRTYMTGEVYAVLLAHSIIGRMAGRAASSPGPVFARGVARGLEGDALLHDLFGARTLALAGEMGADDVPEWLSGLLVGREIRDARAWVRASGGDASNVQVVGGDVLAARYVAALAQAGVDSHLAPRAAAARGLYEIARRARLIR